MIDALIRHVKCSLLTMRYEREFKEITRKYIGRKNTKELRQEVANALWPTYSEFRKAMLAIMDTKDVKHNIERLTLKTGMDDLFDPSDCIISAVVTGPEGDKLEVVI